MQCLARLELRTSLTCSDFNTLSPGSHHRWSCFFFWGQRSEGSRRQVHLKRVQGGLPAAAGVDRCAENGRCQPEGKHASLKELLESDHGEMIVRE
eukprot:1976971-Amphidinium_carterae.1